MYFRRDFHFRFVSWIKFAKFSTYLGVNINRIRCWSVDFQFWRTIFANLSNKWYGLFIHGIAFRFPSTKRNSRHFRSSTHTFRLLKIFLIGRKFFLVTAWLQIFEINNDRFRYIGINFQQWCMKFAVLITARWAWRWLFLIFEGNMSRI